MVRRYRYVAWHAGIKSWIVQRRGYPSPGMTSKTQLCAAKLAAAKWGMSLSSLVVKRGGGRKKAKRGKRSSYAFVYWHAGRQTWYAQVKAADGGYLGHYESEEAAARAVIRAGSAKSLGELRWRQGYASAGSPVRKARAKRARSLATKPSAQSAAKRRVVRKLSAKGAAKPSSVFLTRERFMKLWAIYRTSRKSPSTRLPGDLEDACGRAKWAMSQAGVPYATFWCLLKYGPAREALEAAVNKAAGKGPASPTTPAKALAVMQDALVQLSENVLCREDWAVWTMNCGRGVSHHSGPHCAATALKLVKTRRQARGRFAKSVKLSGQGRRQQLSVGALVLQAVRSHMLASKALARVTAPRTLSEWQEKCSWVADVFATVLDQSPRSYRVLWASRTWLKATMAAAGVQRLRVRDAEVADLLQSWPDCNGHLARMGEGQRYLQKVFDDLGYNGPPECFTMWCCLFNDRAVRRFLEAKPEGWLADRLQMLRKGAAKYRAEHGLWPHPAVLLNTADGKTAAETYRHTHTLSIHYPSITPRSVTHADFTCQHASVVSLRRPFIIHVSSHRRVNE